MHARETLETTVEEMQASNEELKSANEELQSTNEELQSTNEELETSKEELQSVNEELVTVNSELSAKIDLLSRTENDMKALLDSIRIGALFLDLDLNIRRFTAEVVKFFNLIPSDVASFTRPMAMPATGALMGTPASINARQPPQTVAIEEEPLDSRMSETTRTV